MPRRLAAKNLWDARRVRDPSIFNPKPGDMCGGFGTLQSKDSLHGGLAVSTPSACEQARSAASIKWLCHFIDMFTPRRYAAVFVYPPNTASAALAVGDEDVDVLALQRACDHVLLVLAAGNRRSRSGFSEGP